jgi:hypothetical protein
MRMAGFEVTQTRLKVVAAAITRLVALCRNAFGCLLRNADGDDVVHYGYRRHE